MRHANRLLLLLAALTALVLTAAAGVALTPAAHAAGVQDRVGAFIPGTQPLTRPAAPESTCTRPGLIASAAGMTAGFCVAAEDTTAVIGRQADTAVAQDWAGHEVLNLPSEWSIEANDAWVKSVADRGLDVYTGSPLSYENLWDATAGRETVYAREIRQLTEDYGYTWDGDYLRPPSG